MTPMDDDRGEVPRYMLEVKGGDAGTADGPGEPGHIKITPVGDSTADIVAELSRPRPPVTDAGTVDFSAMLRESWQPLARDRMNAVLGRPYLATQLASLLPADVCMRLTDRLEGLIHEAVQRELDKLHDELDQVTAATLARLAAQADAKLEDLKRERFSSHPATRWGG